VIAGGVAVAAGRVAVYSVDVRDGRPAWQLPRAGGPLEAQPAVAGSGRRSVLLFAEGHLARDSRVRAYALATQKHLWDAQLQDVSSSGISVDAGTAFVGDRSGTLYAIDVSSGHLLWKFRGDGVIDAPPAVADGRVYAVTANRSTGAVQLIEVDERTGKLGWRFEPPQLATFGTAPTVHDGSVYVGMGNRVVYALDARSGKERWSSYTVSMFSPVVGSAIAGGDLVVSATYPLSAGVGLYRLDAPTGDRESWFQFDSFDLLSSPVIAGRYALMGLDDGRLVAVDTRSGHEAWEQGTGPGALGAIAPGGDVMVASKSGADGGLVAFRHDPSGQQIDVTSRTELDLPLSLRNYALTFVLIAGGVLLLARLTARWRRPEDETDHGPETEELV
jgi:outer membrane protein assembly factor BamB